MKYSICLFLSLCCLSFVKSQTLTHKEKLQNSYTTYFQAERETIYLHFNKNTFLLMEPIWFKGYIYDKKNGIPFISTTNVYVGLYDNKDNELSKKLFFAQNGVFTGSFDNQKDLPSGDYYVRAYTNYMNNFKEDESYISQPIRIVNSESIQETDTISTEVKYDLQFLPEGGYLITDVTNTVGLKIIDCEGNGVEIKGTIANEKNETVANFKSNEFGLGKFDLLTKKGENYTAHYIYGNKDYSKPLPNSEPEGFSVSVNNYTNATTTFVSLKTNETTLKNRADKTFFMVINQTNKVSVVDIDINGLKTNNTIPIANNKLIAGVNTITFFDDQLNPILERLIFNYDHGLFLKSTVYIGNTTKDSITINIKTSRNDNTPVATKLSTAILSSTSLAYSKKEDIISAFLLKPYLRGYIQNPSYYFTEFDRLKKYNLDLLMLTQGWSKYKWEDIQNDVQKLTHSFDVGLTVEGTINVPKTENHNYSVQMFSLTNNINERASIEEDNHFYFKNFYLKDEAQLNLNVHKNGLKADDVRTQFEIKGNDKVLLNHTNISENSCSFNFDSSTKIIQRDLSTVMDANKQLLDTINLSYIKRPLPETLERKNDYIGNKYGKGVKVDADMRKSFVTLLDYIHSHGFQVSVNPRGGAVTINTRTPKSILANDKPKLIIDDSNMGNNYDMLIGLTLDEIDEIYINPSGMGYGATAGGGIIRIYRTKSIGVETQKSKNSVNEIIVEKGFSVEKEFYVPEFYSLSKKNFLLYGMLDWKSTINTDANGNANYKIFNTNINEVIVVIQGFSEDGKLLSEIKEVKLMN